MKNQLIALRELYDFIDEAKNDPSVPQDVYKLAVWLTDMIEKNEYDWVYDYYMRYDDGDIDDLRFNYLSMEAAEAISYWLSGN